MSTVDQTAEVLHLHFVRGDDFRRRLVFTESAAPLDVSAWEFAAQIRRYAESATEVSFSFDTSDAANGNVDFYLTEAQTATLVEHMVWDLEVTIDDYTLTMFAGDVTVDKDVTRS